MIKVTQRTQPLLSKEKQQAYWSFIKAGYSGGRRIDQNLNEYFDKQKLIRDTQKLRISHLARPTQVSVNDWVKLFKLSS